MAPTNSHAHFTGCRAGGYGPIPALLLKLAGALVAVLVLPQTLPLSRPAFAQSGSSKYALISLIENVQEATARQYGLRDSAGQTMDTLKVIQSPAAGYLGVYHYLSSDGSFHVRVATSRDLVGSSRDNWLVQADFGPHESQPTIAYLADGSFLVVVEADTNGSPTPKIWLRFKHFLNLMDLLSGRINRVFDAPHTLVPENSGAEGTPNVYSASLSPDFTHSTIDVGFHYYMDFQVDRQARGTLTTSGSSSSWATRVETKLNNALLATGDVKGNIGDRDNMLWGGRNYNLHEVQLAKRDFGTWRVDLYDWSTNVATRLAIKTDRRSTAFSNPTFTNVRSPRSNRQAVVVTLFVPSEGAASGEGGELIYYKEYGEPN
jgi:hypothetical protein